MDVRFELEGWEIFFADLDQDGTRADGLAELRAALKLKLAEQNGIVASEVMVTAGANQAYTNVVLALLDAGDPAMLFRPYYFNHLMALQMTGSAPEVILPPSTADLLPANPHPHAHAHAHPRPRPHPHPNP